MRSMRFLLHIERKNPSVTSNLDLIGWTFWADKEPGDENLKQFGRFQR